MIRLYTGEYLISPFVVHFGMNRCSHGCVYCFANLNKPDRQTEASDLARVAKWYDVGSTCAEFEAMQAGHPVLTANDSDPCAKSNVPTFMQLHASSRRFGYRLVYQTRGGVREAEDLIAGDDPTMVYVSLTTDKPDILSKFEPGCPSLEQRMNFISRLRNRGHMVIVGLNPFIPVWWEDAIGVFSRLKAMGVRHVWHQPIHLSRFQVEAMSERFKGNNQDFIKYGMMKTEPYEADYKRTLQAILGMGFNVIRMGVSERLGYWDDYFRLGFPFFPTLDAFVRDCDVAAGGRPALVSLDAFDEWASVFTKSRSVYKEYLVKIGRSVRNKGESTETAKTMYDVHKFLWRVDEYPTPFRVSAFSIPEYKGGWACDDDGTILLAVSASGFEAPEVDCSGFVYLETVERKQNG